MTASSSVKNTSAAGGATVLATVVVWVLGPVHVPLSAEDGSIIAGALSASVLFVWHYGFANILRHAVHGDTPEAAPQAR